MGKKKSKTQKMKKNLKKKQQKKNVNKQPTICLNTEVVYNVALTHPELLEKNNLNKKKTTPKNELKNKFKNQTNKILSKIHQTFKKIPWQKFKSTCKKIKNKTQQNLQKLYTKFKEKYLEKEVVLEKQEENKILSKIKKKIPTKKEEIIKDIEKELPKKINIDKNSKNIFLRLIFELKQNIHIIFNVTLILFFIILLIGLIRVDSFGGGLIFYICALLLFLICVALSYTRYTSGKVFTIILCLCMGLAIYKLQYTYDFIRNLNTYRYEYKTYYVVTFDTNMNKTIYNLNNKSIGLLTTNSVNIERMLNTKLDKINYKEYDDVTDLMSSFYNQEFRAVIVTSNQYSYLKNNQNNGARNVKILYEFKVNALKT